MCLLLSLLLYWCSSYDRLLQALYQPALLLPSLRFANIAMLLSLINFPLSFLSSSLILFSFSHWQTLSQEGSHWEFLQGWLLSLFTFWPEMCNSLLLLCTIIHALSPSFLAFHSTLLMACWTRWIVFNLFHIIIWPSQDAFFHFFCPDNNSC